MTNFSNSSIMKYLLPRILSRFSRSIRRDIILPKEPRFQQDFHNLTSGNPDIDNFIQQTQCQAENFNEIIEWIPFERFINIKYLAEGGYGTVFKAIWMDGYIYGFDNETGQWRREPQIIVCLKSLHDSKGIKKEFLEEVKNQHKYGGKSAIAIYGLTKDPNHDDYMIVMQYAKQGSLKELLYSKFKKLTWLNKTENLLYIAEGLQAIHDAKLVHKDLHSGNIVNDDIASSYITDFGLCKPVSQDLNSEEIYGVLPYVAPELLDKNKRKGYTQHTDIYSFGIIMSEIFTGLPPYYNLPHDLDLVIRICQGYRPEIEHEVPQLLLDLRNKCLDAEPQNRPTAKDLVDMLKQYRYDMASKEDIEGASNEEVKLYKQIEQIEESKKDQFKSTQLSYQTNKQAIYTSVHLGFQNLPEPVNAEYSTSIKSIGPNDFQKNNLDLE